MVTKELLEYFRGDLLACNVWLDKYCLKDKKGNHLENTPDDMHKRLAKEFGRIESDYVKKELAFVPDSLSEFGLHLYTKRRLQTSEQIVEEIYNYFKDFKYIVPQGSIMANLGNPNVIGSLSNCFTIESPYDSYGGIFHTDQELGQLMKRRGGVGTLLDTLRPTGMSVTNAARSTSGVPSFAERYSNTTREVALEGRRGALMLLLSVKHPDIFKFITMKKDRTKVTGANVSVKFSDKFMRAVENNSDFICNFPVNATIPNQLGIMEYNRLYSIKELDISVMKIKASELFDEFISMAHDNAEPGAVFENTVYDYSPDGVYSEYFPDRSNPCSEIHMSANDACRLIASNLFSLVVSPFTKDTHIDFKKLYEVCYIQQRLGDDLVDLEIEAIDKILAKIESDPEPEYIKSIERNLWIKIREKAKNGRRTGSGLTGIGDMLAALNIKYSSDEATQILNELMKIKMQAELDCTIDMSILRGSFVGWDNKKEFEIINGTLHYLDTDLKFGNNIHYKFKGKNNFYQFLTNNLPEQVKRMTQYARRNINWSTVAPTGTVSLMTQTTSGLEPLFKAYYIRRVKVVGTDKRVDFVDQNGDMWTEHVVMHPKFKEWLRFCCRDYYNKYICNEDPGEENIPKEDIQIYFEQSPWYGSEANDIDWEYRIKLQAIIQKYTSNAISSTVNLPNNVSKETVKNIYIQAWKQGLKGITIYRQGSRTGVLVDDKPKDTPTKKEYTTLNKLSKEELTELYITNGKSLNEIGLLFGKSAANVWYYLRKFGIEIRSVKEGSNIANVNHCEITPYIKELIEGELLGDGNLRKYPSSSQFNLNTKYLQYAEWLKKQFEDNGIKVSDIYSRVHPEGNTTYRVQTFSYAEFTDIRNNWYDGMDFKKVPEGLTALTPLQLRQWYIGDGSLSTQSNGRYISCYTSFSIYDKDRLLSMLVDLFGDNVKLHENGNKFYIPAAKANELFNFIGGSPISCYDYKWKNFNDIEELDYFNGSRTGVLVSESANKPVKQQIEEAGQFGYKDAPKRPKELEADYYYETAKGKNYAVIIGMLEGIPYETFVYENPIFTERTVGKIVKISTGVYKFISASVEIENLQLESKYADEKILTRFVSGMLRHGMSPKYIADQVDKSEMNVTSFAKVLSRVLKTYILDEVVIGEKCPSCNQETIIREEGCLKCYSCGYSKC